MAAWAMQMQIGPYVLLAPINAGGTGELWRAFDTRLDRIVAIKRLDGSHGARFEQEAREIAALHHPHICALYDIDPDYLVMEYVEGETLSKVMERGPLPLQNALRYAMEIAGALAAAHAKGIVHRELNPGNVLITSQGVKLLNFAPAKTDQPVAVDQLTQTMGLATMGLSMQGQILGTLQYMSPEQVNGAEAGPLSDIFSFGLILFEMLTGKPAIKGSTPASALAGILKRPAPSILTVAPPALDQVLKRCLEKDPENRWQSVRDLQAALKVAAAAQVTAAPAFGATLFSKLPWASPPVIAAAVLGVVALVLGFILVLRRPPAPAAVRLQLVLPDKVASNGFSISPDGSKLAFYGTGDDDVTRLWLRPLDSVAATPLAGSESDTQAGVLQPFWSPDSKFLAFQSSGKLKKIAVPGGAAQPIGNLPAAVTGGSWNRDNVIVFSANTGPILRVSASGGQMSPVTALDASRQETAHLFPTFLPDGRHFIYLRISSKAQNSGVYVGSVDAKPKEQNPRLLAPTQFGAAFVPSSASGPAQLLFRREGALMTQPFDQGAMALTGQAMTVAEHLGSYLSNGFFSVSSNGVLVYKPGAASQDLRLTWLDSHGTAVRGVWEPGFYSGMALSPDGTQAVAERFDYQSGNGDLWLVNFAGNTGTQFTTHPSRDLGPVWSPDGTRIAFASDRDGAYNLYQKPTKGAAEETLLRSAESKIPTSWSHDGRYLLYTVTDPKTNDDVWVLRLEDRKPAPLLQTKFDESDAQFSPDGRWIAYVSNESGRSEVYVQPFSPNAPGAGGKWMFSRGGGTNPKWAANGKEIRYLNSDHHVISVDVVAAAGFQVGQQHDLFALPRGVFAFDFASDGRVLAALPMTQNTASMLTVVLNWQAGLKK